MVYELKVTLKNVGVPVWRKILVEEETTFAELHHILQIAFQWEAAHLHTYRVEQSNGVKAENNEITPINLIEDEGPSFIQIEQYDEDTEFLDDWFIEVNDKVTYIYDFGDDWQHEIVLTKKVKDDAELDYPICIGARNLAPEEDSRFELISGAVDLTYEHSQEIIDEINDEFEELIEDFSLENSLDFWPETLQLAKEFHRLKPWEFMGDGDIIGVLDPITGTMMYCTILGSAKEMFGLAVYVDYDGFFLLSNILKGEAPSRFDILQYQNSMLLSFEDRNDLEKEEYHLIREYDIPFRGKKSWPSFRRFRPGYSPWFMDNQDAQLMIFALSETLYVANELKKGLILPNIQEDNQILIRIPSENKDIFNFESKYVELDQLFTLEPETRNEISELDLKRISKIKNLLPYQIEYVIAYVDLPILEENDETDIPQLPTLTMAVDLGEGRVIEHDLSMETPEPMEAQMMFIALLQKLNGKPSSVITNYKTGIMIGPLLDDLGIDMEIVNDLPLTSKIIGDLMEDIDNNRYE